MGHYTGNGIVKSGGESIRTLKSLWWYGAVSLRQKSVVTITVKPGVSLEQAQGESADADLKPCSDGSGSNAWVLYDSRGSRTTPSYSQIGDSNLYELTVQSEELKVKYATTSGAVTPNTQDWQ